MPTPAQTAIDQSKREVRVSNLSFPLDLGEFFMSFDFYDYRTTTDVVGVTSADGSPLELNRQTFNANRENIRKQIAKGSFARICLPIPANLVDNFRVEWGAENQGLIAGLLGEVGQSGTDIMNSITNGQTGFDNLVESTSKMFNDISQNDSMVMHATRRLIAQGSPLFGQITDLAFGVAENPNIVMLFRGPTLKQHSFSWKLIARSPEESFRIKQIIATIKRAQHPQKLNASTSAFLKYPSECITEFHSPAADNSQFLYPMRPTVVEDFTINYAPHGMPSFYAGTYDTVGVEISLKLQETSYYLRDSFNSPEEYGYDGFNISSAARGNGAVDTPTGSDDEEGYD